MSASLPSTWKEMHVTIWASRYSVYTLHIIPKDLITSEAYINFGKYLNTSNYVSGSILLTANSISIAECTINGGDYVEAKTVSFNVLYR